MTGSAEPFPSFDLREIPFSTRGSWLDLSPVIGQHRSSEFVHLVSHRNGMHAVLALQPERSGMLVPIDLQAYPARLEWHDAKGRIEAAFDGTSTVRLRGSGLGMRLADPASRLTPFTGSYLYVDPTDGAAVLTSYETGHRYRLSALRGELSVVGAEALGATPRSILVGVDGGPWEVVLEETRSGVGSPHSHRTFDEVVYDAQADFSRYLEAVAPWRDESTPAAALATYVLWSATVEPAGFLARESVLMSMHWMDKVWSWDHCFNALALAPGLPAGALDQFLAPFDHQDRFGALPDSITHSEVLYNYVKPPIHGWALRKLRAISATDLTHEELEEVHARLASWTSFWLEHRRRPGHELPFYQHGNDSGWDNSTTFDTDRVIEAPDLAAFLVIQLEVLAELSDELGRDSARWIQARDVLLRALLDELWTGNEFVAVGALSGRRSPTSSLLNLLPLVLGERLPAEVREVLAKRVTAHLTDYGLATEPVDSPLYEPDGYWRGPIWAPSTALIEDGLRASGYLALADSVSARFRTLCEQSGFAENFDARTGEGLRDRAYTWTAAVYLNLAAAHVAGRQV